MTVPAPQSPRPDDEAADPAADIADVATKRVVMAYVPEGYTLTKAKPRGPRPAGTALPAPPKRGVGTWASALVLTLVVGLVVGYLGGFAVARRTVESRVDVTVHQTSTP